MWQRFFGQEANSTARKLRFVQTPGAVAPRGKDPSRRGRPGRPASVLVAAAAAFSLAGLALSASAASSQNRASGAAKALHVTKDCSGYKGVAGNFCTIRSSNVKALKVGSKIFYLQACCKAALNSDTALYAGPGNMAAGHCLLHYATGRGLCTFSDGTGTLAGFHARVRVKADSSIPDLWHWDGTYGFKKS